MPLPIEMNKDLAQCLADNGYSCIREVHPGFYCGVQRFVFTCGVCCGLDHTGYLNRFCFDTMMDAELFLRDWDGHTPPVIGDDGCTAIK